MKKGCNSPLRKTMCATCPFRRNSPTEDVLPALLERIFSEASHICHSTGSDNAFHRRTGIKAHLCRGARDVQIQFYHRIGFLPEPTDEAWNKMRVQLGLAPTSIQDPPRLCDS